MKIVLDDDGGGGPCRLASMAIEVDRAEATETKERDDGEGELAAEAEEAAVEALSAASSANAANDVPETLPATPHPGRRLFGSAARVN